MDIAAALGKGKIVSFMGEAPIMAFGPEIDDDQPLESQSRFTRHFYWPIDDEAIPFDPIVRGELTPKRREELEARAAKWGSELGAGADFILWRTTPEWCSERDFMENTTKHVLRMRGAFVWLNPKERTA